ncbi:MAG: hypothetical protein SFV51_17995 [Bryobacteraceae bacterium]|nr:hypothetical protein [Bryobacteraceae bacterium]
MNAETLIHVTEDAARVREYCELRQRVYHHHYPFLPAHFGDWEPIDDLSHIVVVNRGGRVIAGARLTISTPDSPLRLPMEEGGFRLSRELPEYRLHSRSYAEISRVAVDPGTADGGAVNLELARMLCRTAAGQGVDLLFAICPRGQLRINRRNAAALGVAFRFFPAVKAPGDYGVAKTLCVYTGAMGVR